MKTEKANVMNDFAANNKPDRLLKWWPVKICFARECACVPGWQREIST
ncbi:hypothetical protein AAFN85_09585 [Mucilaginibacter sp. CAU 1740]